MSYFEQARKRAERRKSPWNILVILACFVAWLALAFILIRGNEFIHRQFFPGESLATHAQRLAVLLAVVPPLIGSIPLGFFAGNLLVWLISPARRVLDEEAKPIPESSFAASQRGLLKLAVYFTTPCVIFGIVGALVPW